DTVAPPGAPAFWITALGADVVDDEPLPFRAVTRTRSVLPTSTPFNVYVRCVAPVIVEQLPPVWSHRRHSYVYVTGCAPDQLPGFAVSVLFSVGVPEIVGGCVFADRKSTRLNSSHLGISYAVFCLKKKIKTVYINS